MRVGSCRALSELPPDKISSAELKRTIALIWPAPPVISSRKRSKREKGNSPGEARLAARV